MKTLVVITGPTAVGKTELTIDIARHYGTPVVSADSRQMYRDLKIGTAAPTEDQLRLVRHFFVGNLALTDYYSASLYEEQALSLITGRLFADGDIALVTGGSMMYIDALCNGIDEIPTVDDHTRETMKSRLAAEGLPALADELRRLDPDHWATVDRSNPRRVVHALEICHMTGRTYSSFLTGRKKPRPFKTVKIGLNIDREELYDRINRRADMMMRQGLLEEAERLSPYRHLNALNTVGYKEMYNYLDGVWSLDEAVERLKGNTRRYARKQLTWFKRDESMTWFSPDRKEDIIRHIDANL